MFQFTRRRSLFAVIAAAYALVSLAAFAHQKIAGPMESRVRYQSSPGGAAKLPIESAVSPELKLTFAGHF